MKRTVIAAGAAALLALSACGSTEESQSEREEEQTSEAAANGGPITLTDADGRTVELSGPAEDVVVLEWQQIEDVLALGVTPVGVADPAGYNTWDTAVPLEGGDDLDVGMRGAVNKNAVIGKDPDLIIVEQGPDLATFEDAGVPVLVTAGADAEDPVGQMKETFTLIAQALGKEDEATDVLAEFDASLEEAKAAVETAAPETRRFVYADAYVVGSTLSVRPFGQGSYMGELGEELGLENAWTGKVDDVYGLGQTDVEGITAIKDAELFYTGTESSGWLEQLESNRLWTGSDFVEDDRVNPFPTGIWTFGGPRSGEQILDAYVEALS
ncbi:ABC transporter substrate-binding protein [Nocardioides sp.]|uniref:ABC transporter substrate-binding protein n=1 Tax=Nocardioides sp. TaxID=35761 RepID=UPI00271B8ED1|nr:ABC transporter substrate-binding protein [Nocardioides sp.]MDO9455462.1 ABC transporter substrate-binding protein [Nocardioides sp.]